MKTGITGYGIKVPRHRLKCEEIVKTWGNNNINYLKGQFNCLERAVLDSDEDIITLSTEAAKNCLENAGLSEDNIDGIYLGTASNPDLLRSSAAIVMDCLTDKNNYFCSDIQFAGKSGTSAMEIAYSMVSAKTAENILVIGTDTINRHMAPGDLREPYSGAGAGALLLGDKNVIAEIDSVSSFNGNYPDDIRPEDERYVRSPMTLNRDKIELGYIKHSIGAAKILFEKSNTKTDDYNYGVFSQLNGKSAYQLGQALGFNKDQIEPSIFADVIGDAGSSSVIIGLAKVLDIAKPGEKILLIGYGAGSGADAISLTVTEEILNYRNNQKNFTNKEIYENTIYVSYAEAMKYEYKYIRPDVAYNTYL